VTGENILPRGNWPTPTSIRFGVGRIAELPEVCRMLGMRRPLLVTDQGLASLAIVRDVLAANESAGLPTGLFSGVRSNPNGGNVGAGVAAFRAGTHDGVIAMGGGSALDAGKTIALMVGQSRSLWDFVWGRPVPTDVNVAGIAPVVTVPTTAGTGSEVESGAVITDESTETKEIIAHPKMQAGIVIGDPALTVGLPPHLTAATGMDALSHCLEAYCVPDYDPMADGMALEGMRLIAEWLPVATAEGGNLEARAQMLAAAMIGAAAFRKGLGAMHALSHPIGAIYDTHHGLTNAVLMPYVLSFNRPAIGAKMERLARFLGLPAPSFDTVLAWIIELREQLAIPPGLAAIGVDERRSDEVARKAAADGNAPTNPVRIDAAGLRHIFERAVRGEL
jgi:alcohol dehydrogenase class IV